MNVVFRCDASIKIGTGHVMRCLSLADALLSKGSSTHFICRAHDGNLSKLIRQRGHRCTVLTQGDSTVSINTKGSLPPHSEWLGTDWLSDAKETVSVISERQVDWLIVDHYAIDVCWETKLRPSCKKLLVIDDINDRKHDCNLLLDQNLDCSSNKYSGLLPDKTKLLCGPKFALLRPEFANMRSYSLARRKVPQLKHILITMGGVDQNNVTGIVLNVLNKLDLPCDLSITVVMGPHAPWYDKIKNQSASMKVQCRVISNVDNMSQLMANSDLAIGAAGSTSWERCCLGLPSIIFVVAENQRIIASALSDANVALVVDENTIIQTLSALLGDTSQSVKILEELSNNARKVTEGHGVELVMGYLQRGAK
jgi:UDP-2,4-diacetamido-2,4,6-trideoxy-beta-L-altropyranose hydrolase